MAPETERGGPKGFATLRKHGLVFVFAAIFGLAAYGVIKVLILVADRLGLPF